MKCPKCNAANADNSKFCTNCGAKLEQKLFCGNCGKENASGTKFCIYCGNNISVIPNVTQPIEPQTSSQTELQSSTQTIPQSSTTLLAKKIVANNPTPNNKSVSINQPQKQPQPQQTIQTHIQPQPKIEQQSIYNNDNGDSQSIFQKWKFPIIGGIAALVVLLIVICLIFFKSSNTDNVNNDGTLSGITDDIQNGDGNIIEKKRRFKREGNQIFLIEDITEIRDGNTSKYTNKKLLGYVEKVFKSPDAINTGGRCDNSNYAGMLTEKYDLDGNGSKDNIKMYQPSDYNSISRHQASDVVIELSNGNKSTLNEPANFVCILITHSNGINDILITGEGPDTLYYSYYQWNGRCYAESPDYTVPDRNPNDLVFTTVKDSIGKKIGNNDTMYVVAKVQKPIEGPKKLVDAIIKWEKSIIGGNSQQSVETLVNNYVKNNWNEIKSLAGDFVNDDDLYGRFLNEFTINKVYENDVLVTLYSNQFVCDGGPRASENNNFYASFNKKLGKVLGLEIFKNNSWNSIEPMLLQEVKDGIFDQSQITSLPKPISLYIANNKVYFEYSSVYDIDPNLVGPGYWTSGISFGLPMSKVKKYFTDEFINCLQE